MNCTTRAPLRYGQQLPERLLVTPTAFNTALWRIVAVRDDGSYEEGCDFVVRQDFLALVGEFAARHHVARLVSDPVVRAIPPPDVRLGVRERFSLHLRQS